MSLSWSISQLQENSAMRSSKSVSALNLVTEELGKQLQSRGRHTALKIRSNEASAKSGFVSSAFKKPVFKAEVPRKHFVGSSKFRLGSSNSTGSDDDYSDIEEMHIEPEPEDDFEGLIPKSERLTSEDFLYILQCIPKPCKQQVLPEVDLSPIPYDNLFGSCLSPTASLEIFPLDGKLLNVPLPDDH